jgi:copper transport protein
VTAGAVWIGGLIAIALMLAKSSDASPERGAATVARFSAVGAWLVGALAVAGTVMAWRTVGTLRLWENNYGIALLIKLGVVVVILGIAAWNRYRLLPAVVRAPRDKPARKILSGAVRAEALLLVAVLGITGVLVTQPPKETGGETPASETRARGIEERLGDNRVRLRVSPVSVGRNFVQVYLRTADGQPFEPATAPNVRFALPAEQLGPLAAPLEKVGPGQYEGAVTLPVAGSWEVRITARTSKYESPSADLRIQIG